jgi:hypothetical protein
MQTARAGGIAQTRREYDALFYNLLNSDLSTLFYVKLIIWDPSNTHLDYFLLNTFCTNCEHAFLKRFYPVLVQILPIWRCHAFHVTLVGYGCPLP